MPPFSDPDFDGKDPGECHHCLGGIYCEAHIVEIKDSEAVDYCYGICSDYEPKEKKDNDSRTTENN